MTKSFVRSAVIFSVLALLVTGLGTVRSEPARAAGAFSDDDGSPHEADINALAASGITEGCGSGRFCPYQSVTRAEMASFIVRALSLNSSSVVAFTDVATSVHQADINALAAADITNGCGSGRYCPSNAVSRAEMAAFLVRALSLGGSSVDAFSDDSSSAHHADINALAAAGFTKGCGSGRYCPYDPVTRAQMASFLVRALGLAPLQRPLGPIGANISASAAGTVLHVDTSNPAASDQNDGSSAEPFRTLGRGLGAAYELRKAGRGVRVVLHPGVYRESMNIGPANNSSNPVLVIEASAPGVVVSGSDVWTGWRSIGNGRYEGNWSANWGVASGAPNAIVGRREMVFINGEPLRQVLAENELAAGTFVVFESEDRIILQPPTGVNPSSARVEIASRPQPLRILGARNVIIRGLIFEHGNAPFDTAAVEVIESFNVLLDDIEVRWSTWSGLGVCCSSAITVDGSLVRDNGGGGMTLYKVESSLFAGNSTVNNNWRGAAGGFTGWSIAGVKAGVIHQVAFENHTTTGNQARGFWLDNDIKDVWVQWLRSCDNLTEGVFLEAIQGPVTILDSRVCNNGSHGVLTANVQGITLQQSTVCGNNKSQLRLSGDAVGRRFTEWKSGTPFNVPLARDVTVLNSIFAGSGLLFESLVGADSWTAILNTFRSDRNEWHNPNSSLVFRPGGNGGNVSLDGWRRATGQDIQSTFATSIVSCAG